MSTPFGTSVSRIPDAIRNVIAQERIDKMRKDGLDLESFTGFKNPDGSYKVASPVFEYIDSSIPSDAALRMFASGFADVSSLDIMDGPYTMYVRCTDPCAQECKCCIRDILSEWTDGPEDVPNVLVDNAFFNALPNDIYEGIMTSRAMFCWSPTNRHAALRELVRRTSGMCNCIVVDIYPSKCSDESIRYSV